ncbi:hypothetical protein ACP70R_009187 [Stipagrostis hirtigluma subsp. patula]
MLHFLRKWQKHRLFIREGRELCFQFEDHGTFRQGSKSPAIAIAIVGYSSLLRLSLSGYSWDLASYCPLNTVTMTLPLNALAGDLEPCFPRVKLTQLGGCLLPVPSRITETPIGSTLVREDDESLENHNWAMDAVLAAPLHAELRFAGRRIDATRLAAAGRAIAPSERDELHLAAKGEIVNASEALGSDAVAELVKKSVAGEFDSLELKLSGKVRYRPVHVGSYRLAASCPLKLTAPAAGTNVMVLQGTIKCH